MTLNRRKRVLIVDDDRSIHLANKYILKDQYDCLSAYNGDEARVIVANQALDIVLMDIHMRRENEGLEYLPQLKEIDPDLDVVVVSSNVEVDLASRAIRAGASSYLHKEHSPEQLVLTIETVISKRELLRENQHYVRDRSRLLEKNRIIGTSPAIRKLLQDIEKIRRSKVNVVVAAETGCGKELVARHIGALGGQPFVAVDSATISSSMAESILFGHEKGAFTGAVSQTKGLFEEANGGTIYFDEIVNMPLEIQAKLLRVIEQKEITRLGSTKVLPLEFRVICATNKDLEKLIEQGQFKDDLYQRLSVITVRIPPLRERTEDIPLLASHFFERSAQEGSPRGFSDSAMELLLKYRWPGNVRELSNIVASLCAMLSGHELVEAEDLPAKIREATFVGTVAESASELSEITDFHRYMHQLEGRKLAELYQIHGGSVAQMSRSLKISRSHLYSKLLAHGIHKTS